MTEKIKCEICGELLPIEIYMQHKFNTHGIDIYAKMRSQARIRGMAWTGLVFTIGVLVGILMRGLL